MTHCPYCGLEPRDDYPVEFRCGSYGNGHRSKECFVLEIGLLKEQITDRERERDHANLVADTALRENKSLVERVKRLEEALAEIAYAASHPLGAGQSLTLGKIESIAIKAKEAKP